MIAKVFDMFTQVDGALDRTQGGLGIGLTIVRRLVELHGGSVEARSDGEGMGSVFTVHLRTLRSDRVARAVVPVEGTIDVEVGNMKRLSVLIADDNADAANTFAMMLRLMKYDVESVYDGQQAVEAVARIQPDVAFLDIGMPNMNGYEAARAIRLLPRERPLTLVAVTGWGQDDDRRSSREAGFDHHLVKPVDPTMLKNFLASLSSHPDASSNDAVPADVGS
jgi:CheY-like chemotaxis protein